MGSLVNYNSRTINYINSNGTKRLCAFHLVIMDDFIVLKQLLDDNLIRIIYGDDDYSLKPMKKKMLKFLSKKTEKQKRGYVAELFVHIFLNEIGFIQECLFRNLEEESMKKGFDGLYSKEGLFWLVESKSSYTKGTYHRDRIKKAIDDLRDKIEGRSSNNPFMNAVYHIKVAREVYNKNLLKTIQRLSKEYSEDNYHSISEFNIIPVSTIYFYHGQSIDEIVEDVCKLLTGHNYKDILVICIDNNIYHDFISYLGE